MMVQERKGCLSHGNLSESLRVFFCQSKISINKVLVSYSTEFVKHFDILICTSLQFPIARQISAKNKLLEQTLAWVCFFAWKTPSVVESCSKGEDLGGNRQLNMFIFPMSRGAPKKPKSTIKTFCENKTTKSSKSTFWYKFQGYSLSKKKFC